MRYFNVYNLRQKPHSPFAIRHSPFAIPRFSDIHSNTLIYDTSPNDHDAHLIDVRVDRSDHHSPFQVIDKTDEQNDRKVCLAQIHGLNATERRFSLRELAQNDSVVLFIKECMRSYFSGIPRHMIRHVLFGFTPDELRAVPPVFVYLLHLHKYFIWRARNDFRFRDVRPSAIELINSIKIRLKFNLSILSKRFVSSRAKRRFVRQWGASGRFAKYSNGSIILVI